MKKKLRKFFDLNNFLKFRKIQKIKIKKKINSPKKRSDKNLAKLQGSDFSNYKGGQHGATIYKNPGRQFWILIYKRVAKTY